MIHNTDSNMYTWTLIMLYIVRYSPWSSGPPTMFLSVTSDNATVFCYDFPTATTQQIIEPEIIFCTTTDARTFWEFLSLPVRIAVKLQKRSGLHIVHDSALYPRLPRPSQATIHDNAASDHFYLLFLCPNIAKVVATSAQLWVGFSDICSMPLLPHTAAP